MAGGAGVLQLGHVLAVDADEELVIAALDADAPPVAGFDVGLGAFEDLQFGGIGGIGLDDANDAAGVDNGGDLPILRAVLALGHEANAHPGAADGLHQKLDAGIGGAALELAVNEALPADAGFDQGGGDDG